MEMKIERDRERKREMVIELDKDFKAHSLVSFGAH